MADGDADTFDIYNPWRFIHSDEFTTDIIIEEVQEVYSTGPPITEDGQQMTTDTETVVQYFSYTKEDTVDESDIHEEKFMLRFLATNTNDENRYLWVNDDGEVRTDGSYSNLATFFEVIHWCTTNNYQLLCYGGGCKGNILYMDGTSLKTRKYHETADDHDITTKFQMNPRGSNISVRAFISKTGVALYFDNEGNYRPEGPTPAQNKSSSSETNTQLQPLYFITANVKVLKVTSV